MKEWFAIAKDAKANGVPLPAYMLTSRRRSTDAANCRVAISACLITRLLAPPSLRQYARPPSGAGWESLLWFGSLTDFSTNVPAGTRSMSIPERMFFLAEEGLAAIAFLAAVRESRPLPPPRTLTLQYIGGNSEGRASSTADSRRTKGHAVVRAFCAVNRRVVDCSHETDRAIFRAVLQIQNGVEKR